MKLSEYKSKRDFKQTAEPDGNVKNSKGKLPIFVIQMHNASRLHFDFRLEVDGVLKSWAVPKGLSTNTKERHLAMMVEDHPYAYKDFEGIIPEGNYGAGEVIVWDTGEYSIQGATNRKEIEQGVIDGIKNGDVKMILNGKKAKGKYAFVKFKRAGDNAWLLLKEIDDFVDSQLIEDNKSVLSGKTLEDIKLEVATKVWNSSVVKPMLATLTDKPFDNKDWLYEYKFDGYRAIADVYKNQVRLYSRNNITLNNDYPLVVEALKGLDFNVVLDGEIVVEDNKGKPSFEALQNYKNTKVGTLVYYVFDILKLNDIDTTVLPLIERKKLLEKVLRNKKLLKRTEYMVESGTKLFNKSKKDGMEGIIAKKIDSTYFQGRSTDWLKIKSANEQEFVIGGYTKPEGNRKGFGSLLLGVYSNGDFIYVGNTGSGFSYNQIHELKLKLDKYIIKKSPFKNNVDLNNEAEWISPKLVVQVRFSEWTKAGMLRQAIFKGIREDKLAKYVKREIA